MDTLVRLKIEPLGPWITPWQADSLLGVLAVSWMRSHGVDALRRDFLEPWLANEPRFVVSDAFPGDTLPAPANFVLPMWEWSEEDRKIVKRLRFLPRESFREVQKGLKPDLHRTPGVSIESHVLMRNSISRSTDTTTADDGLFEVPYSKLSDPEACLIVYARADNEGMDILLQSLTLLGQTGFGARASTGHGGFEISGEPEPCPELDDVPGADGFVSLSTYQPVVSDPVEGYWRSFIKYGKMTPEFHRINTVFKRPQVMLDAGACFRTNAPPEPFYGGIIDTERLLGDGDREKLGMQGVRPIQAAFALAVPMIWKEEGV